MKFSKKDFYFSIVTGCITGFAAWKVFSYLGRPTEFGYSLAWLMVVVPILWILGVNLGYFLGRWLGFFNQFGKFSAIGFTNFAVTAGVLNILLSLTGYASGIGYSLISGASFIVGVLSSYIWNKFWAFDAAQSHGGGREFGKFFVVTILSFIINVGIASLVVNYVHPILGFNLNQWANIGAVAGSAVALIVSFVGFKMAVFKK